jgi:phosphatidylglycerophosphatase A
MGLTDRLSVLLATGLYLSYIPSKLLGVVVAAAPGAGGFQARLESKRWSGAGMIGSLEGLALLPLLPTDPFFLILTLAAAAAAACWICGRADAALGTHDDSRIVLDEIVGFWTAAALLPHKPSILIAAFILFRILDTVKLPPYGWLERLPGGIGVVADDVGAGVVANLGVRLLLAGMPQCL